MEQEREKIMAEFKALSMQKTLLEKKRDNYSNNCLHMDLDLAEHNLHSGRRSYDIALQLLKEIQKYELQRAEFNQRFQHSGEKRELADLTEQLNRVSVGPPFSTLEMWYQDLQHRSSFADHMTVSYPSFRRGRSNDGGVREEFGFSVLYCGVSLCLKVFFRCPGCSGGDSSVPSVKVESDTFLLGLEERVQELVLSDRPVDNLIPVVIELMEKFSSLAWMDLHEKNSARIQDMPKDSARSQDMRKVSTGSQDLPSEDGSARD